MKCLVTGGAGFIGSNLVDALIDDKHDVVVVDDLSTGHANNINSKAHFREVSITDFKIMQLVLRDIDYVFHCAALPRVQPSILDPITSHGVNLNGTLNILKAAQEAGVKKVIYSASSSAYGNQKNMPLHEDMVAAPMSPYGLQKYVGELYCRLFSEVYNLPTVSLRYFNVYGNRQVMGGAYCLVMAVFVQQRIDNLPMTITGDGEQRRDFTSVDDTVKANILAMHSDNVGGGEVLNIGAGKSYSVNQLADIIGGPRVHIAPRLEPRETLADNSLAKKLIGWSPNVVLEDWLTKYKKGFGL